MEETIVLARKLLLNGWVSYLLFFVITCCFIFIFYTSNKSGLIQDKIDNLFDRLQKLGFLKEENKMLFAKWVIWGLVINFISTFIYLLILVNPLLTDTLGMRNSDSYLKTSDCLIIKQRYSSDGKQSIYCDEGNSFFVDLGYFYIDFYAKKKQSAYTIGQVYDVKYLPATRLIVVSNLKPS